MPTSMRLHPTFYVGRLKRYHRFSSSLEDSPSTRSHERVPSRVSGDLPPGHPTSSQCVEEVTPPSQGCGRSADTGSATENEHTSLREVASPTEVAQSPRIEQMISQGPEPSVQMNNEHTLVEERSSMTQGCILPPSPPPLIDNQGNVMWIVDSLVGHRHTGRRPCKMTREFHVHWLGYPPPRGLGSQGSTL